MIIALGHKAGVGKDTVAKIIQYLLAKEKVKQDFVQRSILNQGYEAYDYTKLSGWEIKKFADPIKDTICLWLGCSRKDLEDREFKNKELWDGMTPRILMQLLGTECGRQIINPDIWVNILFKDYVKTTGHQRREGNITYTEEDYPNWIITDLRFPNEAKAIKRRGGVLVIVNRDIESDTPKHESENALDGFIEWDYIIDNNGTEEELVESVKGILTDLKLIN